MRLTLKAKLGATFATIVLLAGAGMFFGINKLGQLNETFNETLNENVERVQLINRLDAEAVRIDRGESDFILAESNAEMDEYATEIEDGAATVADLTDRLYALSGATGRAQLDAFRVEWEKFLASDAEVQKYGRQQSIRIARRIMQDEGRDGYLAVLESVESLAEQLSGSASTAVGAVSRDNGAEQYQAVTDIIPALLRVRVNLLNVLTSADNPEAQQRYAEVVETRVSELQAQVDKASRLLSREHRASFDAIETGIAEWLPVLNEALAKGLENGDYMAVQVANTTSLEARRAATAILENMKTRLEAEVDQAKVDSAAAYERSRVILIGILAAAVLISIIAATWIVLNITRAVSSALGFANAVAAGDLNASAQVKSNDEMKDLVDALNAMAAKLREVVGEVTGAVRNVASGSQEMAATAEQLSQGATEQAASAEEASSSMEQMTANIKQSADNASQTQKIARDAANDAEVSGQAVAEAVGAMETIAEKILIVQEIARQTDLLALNAAVEAARAGEHGRGFAVVAAEVRKLAERSQAAAQEISGLSGDTVKAAQSAGEMLTKLVPDIKKSAELIAEISAASNEQNAGASQVNVAIQQLDKVTQQNTSASEEMSATAEELSSQAEQLQAAIAYFRVDEQPALLTNGTRPASASTAPKSQVSSRPRRDLAVRNEKAKGGFALDMGHADDELDAEFERHETT
ncbi:hypothetical protein L861_06000 [Litchfieldella anticariensis FP35 = DSM 16096]|uniref:Methyl-accepting chemotaxis protein n=1 Tax=Litchfieldella anticariensis (strain DSM 16096 / CECT 5854 / CIP 108499 / LMG 22089 / FP35) TaxID=1121939 RepID=S2L705_LITA3|nr:methyl-accepting chemotaxis protein [Halomonas anticariensis]EPC00491.1 hypothetical protein L861_06000 [Halomonas anticariensis FP35 = DSM 16096]